MRSFLYLILFIHLSACQSNNDSENQDIDTQIMECIKASFTEENIDISKKMLELEDVLIEDEVLVANTGEAYYALLTTVRDSEEPLFKWNSSLEALSNHWFDANHNTCIDALKTNDSLEYQQSKYNQIQESLRNLEELNYDLMSNVYKTVLTPSDCEKPLYKTLILFFIIGICEPGIPVNLPSE